jgi:hypothetical protein
MKTRFDWTTGKVVFLYACGLGAGVQAVFVVNAAAAGDPLLGPVLGLVVALMLPALPIAHAYRKVTTAEAEVQRR